MKKTSFTIAFLLAIFMVGCSNNDEDIPPSSSSVPSQSETSTSQSEEPIDSIHYLTINEESVASPYFGFVFDLPQGYRFMHKGEVSTAFGLAGESYDKNHEEKTAAYIINDEDAVTMEIIVQDTDLSTSEADASLEVALAEVFLSLEKDPEISFFSDDWGKLYGTTPMQGSEKQVHHYILVKNIENKLCQITISFSGEKDIMSVLSTAFPQIV